MLFRSLLAFSQLSTLTPQHFYYHTDGNGNVTMLINSLQLAVAKYLYEPFGSTLSSIGPLADVNVYRFSSKEYHPASGIYYYGRRFYDPNLQSWLNRDPLGEQAGVNLYAFDYNAPVNEFDTDGQFVTSGVAAATTLGTADSAGGAITITVTGGGGAATGIGLVGAATVAGLVVAVPAAVGLVGYDLHLANQLDQLNRETDEAEERIKQQEAELQRRRPSKKDPERGGYYTCLARCNVHPTPYTDPDTKKPCKAPPESECPRGTEGWGTAKLEQVAAKRAEDNAQEAIRGHLGCRTEHCHVIRCWRN